MSEHASSPIKTVGQRKRRRRARAKLTQFYHGEASTEDMLNIDEATFDPTVYLEHTLKGKGVRDLVPLYHSLDHSIVTLQTDLKTLVHDNFDKFLEASKVVETLQSEVNIIGAEAKDLMSNVEHLGELSMRKKTRFTDRVSEYRKNLDLRTFFIKFKYIFDFPLKLNLFIEQTAYHDALKLCLEMKDIIALKEFGNVKKSAMPSITNLKRIILDRLQTQKLSHPDALDLATDLYRLDDAQAAEIQESWRIGRESSLSSRLLSNDTLDKYDMCVSFYNTCYFEHVIDLMNFVPTFFEIDGKLELITTKVRFFFELISTNYEVTVTDNPIDIAHGLVLIGNLLNRFPKDSAEFIQPIFKQYVDETVRNLLSITFHNFDFEFDLNSIEGETVKDVWKKEADRFSFTVKKNIMYVLPVIFLNIPMLEDCDLRSVYSNVLLGHTSFVLNMFLFDKSVKATPLSQARLFHTFSVSGLSYLAMLFKEVFGDDFEQLFNAKHWQTLLENRIVEILSSAIEAQQKKIKRFLNKFHSEVSQVSVGCEFICDTLGEWMSTVTSVLPINPSSIVSENVGFYELDLQTLTEEFDDFEFDFSIQSTEYLNILQAYDNQPIKLDSNLIIEKVFFYTVNELLERVSASGAETADGFLVNMHYLRLSSISLLPDSIMTMLNKFYNMVIGKMLLKIDYNGLKDLITSTEIEEICDLKKM
ncbi:hypothetical protein PCE1_001387 [Barthelona sp. PCE]